MPRFQRGGRASHDQTGPGFRAASHGDLPRVIAGRVARFIGTVVLLVDYDESQVGDGRENRASGADHHPRLSAPEPHPFGELPAPGETGMEHRVV